MPRPSDPLARDRLLDAARAVFSEKGLDRAKVEDITQRAQLSKGAFYLHFASKEEAFQELLSGVVSHLRVVLEDTHTSTAQMAAGDVAAYLRFWRERDLEVFQFIWDNRGLMAMMLEGGGSANYQHLIQDFAVRAERQIAAVLQEGVRLGIYREDLDVVGAASFMAGGYDRVARQLVRAPEKPDLERLLIHVQRFVLLGVAAPDTSEALRSLTAPAAPSQEKAAAARLASK